jgi:hypothetical protein
MEYDVLGQECIQPGSIPGLDHAVPIRQCVFHHRTAPALIDEQRLRAWRSWSTRSARNKHRSSTIYQA